MTLYRSYYERSRTHLALDKDTPISRPATPLGNSAVVAFPEGGPPSSLRTARGLNARRHRIDANEKADRLPRTGLDRDNAPSPPKSSDGFDRRDILNSPIV
jgi:hypothetical protein